MDRILQESTKKRLLARISDLDINKTWAVFVDYYDLDSLEFLF